MIGIKTLFTRLVQSRSVVLSLSLSLLVLCLLFVSEILLLRGNPDSIMERSREVVTETLAVQLSTLVYVADEQALQHAVSEFVKRSSGVVFASLTRTSGRLLAEESAHGVDIEPSTFLEAPRVTVPIYDGATQWGSVEVAFKPVNRLKSDSLHFGFLVVGSFVFFLLFLRRTLMQLDPSRAVPERVNSAFNLFSEGVVILDSSLRIMLVNQSAAKLAGEQPDALLGKTLDSWPWVKGDSWQAPWVTSYNTSMGVSDNSLYLESGGESRLIVVSCSLVGEQDMSKSGVMVTLNDRSAIQKKNHELSIAVRKYKEAEQSLSEKNRELEMLAWSDPLTGLLNRRKFMQSFDDALAHTVQTGEPLTCLMLDIDFFKAINDNYGHAVGDEVIIAVAHTLKQCSREFDIVGRYGGEEFVVVMPDTPLPLALELAERLRAAVQRLSEDESVSVSKVTASMGVASVIDEAANDDIDAMLDRADKALYVAKESGRNRVIAHEDAAQPVVNHESDVSDKHNDQKSDAVVCAIDDPLEPLIVESNHAGGDQVAPQGGASEFAANATTPAHPPTGNGTSNEPYSDFFVRAISHEIMRADRANQSFGVLLVDVKDLGSHVKRLGQKVCSQLVQDVFTEIQENLRASDMGARTNDEHNVSYLADNQYGILLTDLSQSDHILPIVLRIRRMLLRPLTVGSGQVEFRFHIGIALYPAQGADAAQLLQSAIDARIEAGRQSGTVAYCFATSAMQSLSEEYLQLESDLYKAVADKSMDVYFQPKFDMATRTINSVEALVRWLHPTKGFVSPSVFIPMAESNGVISDIFSQVLEVSLLKLNEWDRLELGVESVSLNLSGTQLRDEKLVPQLLGLLEKAKVAPSRVGVELTEKSIIQSPEQARVSLGKLHEAGVTVSMDDFGTGYTSLGLLAELSLDSVKIDRSFVDAMQTSERSRAIVESVINMAHALRLLVVAEGVETNEQLMTLDALGCDQVQGFLICQALPEDDIEALLKRENQRARRKIS